VFQAICNKAGFQGPAESHTGHKQHSLLFLHISSFSHVLSELLTDNMSETSAWRIFSTLAKISVSGCRPLHKRYMSSIIGLDGIEFTGRTTGLFLLWIDCSCGLFSYSSDECGLRYWNKQRCGNASDNPRL
jgi:hypothetical protein